MNARTSVVSRGRLVGRHPDAASTVTPTNVTRSVSLGRNGIELRSARTGQLTETEFMTTVESTPLLCDVTAMPASTVEPRLTVAVEPGMSVHVVPSGEV